MILIYLFSASLAFLYIFLITHFMTAWNEITEWSVDEGFKPETKVSIIIPFRNESGRLQHTLKACLSQHYPKSLFEVIAVDDHSEDSSLQEAMSFPGNNLKVFSLTENESQGKKAAIHKGVREASGQLIITTDADGRMSREWLRNAVSYYEYYGKPFIVGMVSLSGRENALEAFQVLDTCGMMGVHATGIHHKTHFLANGANLIFEKQLYNRLDPYRDNKNLQSGDDIFFIQKVAQEDAAQIGFLKCKQAVFETGALYSWKDLINQRVRWASKSKYFGTGFYKWMSGLIWLLNVSILLNFLLIPFTGGLSLFIALTQLFIKAVMDYLFLANMSAYFDKKESLKKFFPAIFIHLGYIVFAGAVALRGRMKYRWKGREVH